MTKRSQTGIERRYVVEYVMKNYPPNTRVKYNAPLGNPATQIEGFDPKTDLKYLKPWRKYTDAIVVNPPHLDIIEAKIWYPEKGITDLLEYRELLEETPELNEFLKLTKRLILVIPISRPHWLRMAKRYEVNLIVWRPDWVVPHLQKRGLI